jgi:perosamine synthetase
MSQNKIPWAEPYLFGNEKFYLNKAIDSLWISGGDYILKLENLIKKKFNSKYAFAVSNGTAAINLAFLAIDLKPGDEIIVPGFGYMAAANIGRLMNLKVKFSDVNRNTFCVDLVSLKKVISAKTKAVVIINTYGNMHDVLSIKKFLKKRDIKLIEDAAESFGSKHCGMYSGTIGDIGTFSFHATKTIVTGEGGMVLTNNKNLANKISLYRSHGVMKERYKHYVHGHNFRLTNMQAAIGYGQFKHFDKIAKKRNLIYKWYLHYLDKANMHLQYIPSSTNFLPWTLALVLKSKQNLQNKYFKKLTKNGIEARKGFYSSNRMKIFNTIGLKSSIKISDYLSKNIICLPFYYKMNKEKVRYISNMFNKLHQS